ncbi:glycosyltransferase family 4 protein [Niveispirillum sp. KHB5.9]|uniref:glycosyltransferase family 4 protein n=1 Tax=Niveispirillum sp. KHB5.9 TaxID=3400269 RepID=UPI003A8C862B
MAQNLALTWQLTEIHGWGLVGVHTALCLVDRHQPPLLLEKPAFITMRPSTREKLEGLMPGYEQISALSAKHGGKKLMLHDCTMLHALGNGFIPGASSDLYQGENGNIGVIAFEDTMLDRATLDRARKYDRIIVHSNYNRDLLLARGLPNVRVTFQGVDPTEMPLLPRTGLFGDRFVVFSGGKIEYRKAQDVVLAAFRIFRERHPDALLVTAWHNAWPHTSADIAESPLTPKAPTIDTATHKLCITEWATDHGVPADGFVDLGFLTRAQIAPILAECHAALFPNRCEGATNLVAMEAMACGIPTILSDNTGHRDLIREGNCLALKQQTQVPDKRGNRQGWCDSSVDEAVAHLETLYVDRKAAQAIADRGKIFIRTQRTWRDFAESFIEASA